MSRALDNVPDLSGVSSPDSTDAENQGPVQEVPTYARPADPPNKTKPERPVPGRVGRTLRQT